jgi:hypothetical protein
MLAPDRARLDLKGRPGTKPGTLLKHQIPVRTFADRNKAQAHVFTALKEIRDALPFPLRGIDSDNGSESIDQEKGGAGAGSRRHL